MQPAEINGFNDTQLGTTDAFTWLSIASAFAVFEEEEGLTSIAYGSTSQNVVSTIPFVCRTLPAIVLRV